MSLNLERSLGCLPWVTLTFVALLISAPPADARVKKIVIDKKVSPAFDGRAFGDAGPYETLAGRAFGELDPGDPHNALNAVDASGVPSVMPPKIKRVIKMMAPKVDADGNELGGVPVVLRDAPLGTYLGWNITSAGFHKGLLCNYAGGMIPFARTKAERLASGDPRGSVEERYGTHEGYVRAVQAAAASAVAQGFLLQADAEALIAQAAASDVLKP